METVVSEMTVELNADNAQWKQQIMNTVFYLSKTICGWNTDMSMISKWDRIMQVFFSPIGRLLPGTCKDFMDVNDNQAPWQQIQLASLCIKESVFIVENN